MQYSPVSYTEAAARATRKQRERSQDETRERGDFVCGGCGRGCDEGFFDGPFFNDDLNVIVGGCCIGRKEKAE